MDTLVCQMDLLPSIAEILGADAGAEVKDGKAMLPTFLGKASDGRDELVLEATSHTALRKRDWQMIPPYPGKAVVDNVLIEIGNSPDYQLCNLREDTWQQNNRAKDQPEKLAEMLAAFKAIRGVGYGDTELLVLE